MFLDSQSILAETLIQKLTSFFYVGKTKPSMLLFLLIAYWSIKVVFSLNTGKNYLHITALQPYSYGNWFLAR